jgi:thioesterase domain-containing protein
VEKDRASFDIVICDRSGRVVVEIHEFKLQRLAQRDPLAILDRLPATLLESDQPVPTAGKSGDLDPSARALALSVAQGIRPDEGMAAFERVIDGRTPREVVISSLDLTALSKLASQLADTPPPQGIEFERPALDNDYVEPSTDDQRRMVELWKELLGIASIGVNDSFFDLGGHSLIAARLFTMIKDAWGVSLPVGTLLESPTVSQLVERVDQSREQRLPATLGRPGGGASASSGAWSSLVALRRDGSRPPIFCVAGKGGNPMNLRHLAARLGEDQPFYGIQHRGVDGVMPPHATIEEMAAACIRDVRRIDPDGPYLLGGFSAGGLVAFEMAKALLGSGQRVALLFLLDTWDPAFVHRRQGSRWSKHLTLLRHRGPVYLFEKTRDVLQQVSRRLANRMRRGSALGTATDDILPSTPQQATAEAWKRMEERYVARPETLSGILYRPYRSQQQTDWTSLRAGNQYNGWDQFLLGGVDVVELPGGHSTMCEEPHVRILAKRLSAAIDSALARSQAAPPTFMLGEGMFTSAPQSAEE